VSDPTLYRSPSREYLVRLLNDMRNSSGRAQRSLLSYQQELSKIQQGVAARAAEEEWDEEAQRLVFRVESENNKKVRAAFADYIEWRQNAEWHAAVLRTEAAVYYMLGDPPQEDQQIIRSDTGEVIMTPAAAEHTQMMEALTGEGDYGTPQAQ
jgi:hypothetical protein